MENMEGYYTLSIDYENGEIRDRGICFKADILWWSQVFLGQRVRKQFTEFEAYSNILAALGCGIDKSAICLEFTPPDDEEGVGMPVRDDIDKGMYPLTSRSLN